MYFTAFGSDTADGLDEIKTSPASRNPSRKLCASSAVDSEAKTLSASAALLAIFPAPRISMDCILSDTSLTYSSVIGLNRG